MIFVIPPLPTASRRGPVYWNHFVSQYVCPKTCPGSKFTMDYKIFKQLGKNICHDETVCAGPILLYKRSRSNLEVRGINSVILC